MAAGGAPAQDADLGFPLSRAAARLLLEQADDAALRAQERHFPEHYDALISQLVELKRQGHSPQAGQALVQASRRNWQRYNELVRQGDPGDWRVLLGMRRNLFALIGETDGAEQCLAYEYRGTQALTAGGNRAYRGPVSAYIGRFIEAAARARDAPREWREMRGDDLDQLYASLEEGGADPELLDALRPADTAHPRFCEAMVATLDAALTLQGEAAAQVWRFLVTTQEPGR